ncbi:hypothetical protein IFM89_034696 [Coptis chinensis]|uniref:Dolichyl-diphosphooligosaccharide--protein glycosyltransferase subunit 1 n=1 Tax=Coptis chinensis TaxID=261450 RepID=A0A835LGI4_9MAGN|nr:hypothetical protein IFM89_034696 [Coptis chinensis]
MREKEEEPCPFAVVQELLREVEISHWGSVQVTEHYKLVHAGARHKGIFSRVEYQSRPSIRGISSFKHLLVQLPPRVHFVYYRDGIGNISTSRLRVGAKKGCIQKQYLVEEAMMYQMEYIHDGNLGSHKNGRRVIMNEDIERAHPMDKKGKQYVLPNIEYQQVRKWVLTHSLENAEWEEKYQVYLQSQKSRGKNRRGSQANKLDYIPWLRLQLQNENVSPFKRIVDGPSFTAVSYNRYTANGYVFYTSDSESTTTTQNSGVSMKAVTSFRAKPRIGTLLMTVTYYGVVKRILELDYVEFKQTAVLSVNWVKEVMSKHPEASGFEANESKQVRRRQKTKGPRFQVEFYDDGQATGQDIEQSMPIVVGQVEIDLPLIRKECTLRKLNTDFGSEKNMNFGVYDKFPTDAERKRNVPSKVKKEEWEAFVDMCSTEEDKTKRFNGKLAREQMKNPHTTGRMGAVPVIEQLKKNSPTGEVSRTEGYVAIHTRRDGSCINFETKQSLEEIDRLVSNEPNIVERDLDNDPIALVIGRDGRGRVRGLGSGVTKTVYHASAPYKEIAQREKRAAENSESGYEAIMA